MIESKFRVCWKERPTGLVYKDDAISGFSKALARKEKLALFSPHLFWIEDEKGMYCTTPLDIHSN